MNWLLASIEAHPWGWSIGAFLFFTAGVASMPPLPPKGEKIEWFRFFYQWFYDFAHIMSNQVSKLFDEKLKARGVGLALPNAETAAVQRTTTTQETTAVSVAQS